MCWRRTKEIANQVLLHKIAEIFRRRRKNSSHKATKPQRGAGLIDIEALGKIVVDCGYHQHRESGPGLLESVYETLLFEAMKERGLAVERQVSIPIKFRGIEIKDAFRADLLVEKCLLIELKSTERHAPVHAKQLLTYLRLMNLPLGFLINFGTASYKDSVSRLANNYHRPMA
jgi:GxxExxY protein